MPRVRGRSIEWLLVLLILRHHRAVDRSWLAGTLWPDSDEGQARHNLRDALMHLRKALGSESRRLQSPTRDTLTFDLEGAVVDVLQFDAAIKTGEGEAALRNAVDLYSGPLLEGCFEEWATPERISREQACLRALEILADTAEQRGDFGEALELLRRVEAIEALRDTTRRALMRVLAASGDAPAALNCYREYRLRLREIMNVEPDEETVRLYQQIRETARQPTPQRDAVVPTIVPSLPAPATPASLPSSLPHPLTLLIGREQERCDIQDALSRSRLVTLVGGGGVGKTRLAIEVARGCASEFADGAAFVALAPLSDPAILPTFVATTLGIREEATSEPASLLGALVGWLSAHEILLVLDNCEHLVEATASLVHTLLERCPLLRILTTSRQRLGLTGEIAWRVPSLPSPAPDGLSPRMPNLSEKVLEYPAIQLFVERAGMARPGFRLTDDDALAVAQICQRLDGIPLAIELAAARVSALSIEQIASRLSDRFRLLKGGPSTALPRQQTLRALIDWSYDLLTAEERTLLCRLSVFAGGWALEAAEQICCDASLEDWEILDLLTSLTNKSLVVAETGETSVRYRLPETVREYALERLRERKEERTARDRHAEHYLALAEKAYPFVEKRELSWLDLLETEHDNLRAALTYYETGEEHIENTVRLVTALAPFWPTRAHYYEQRTWLLRLASRATSPTKARAELLRWAAGLFDDHKDFAQAKQMLTERLAIVRQLGHQQEIARALNSLAGLISHPRLAGPEYDSITARALVEESLAIARELGDQQGTVSVLYMLGHLAQQIGDNREARTRWMECDALDQELGNKGGYVLWVLGELALESGDYAEARRFFGRYMTDHYELGIRWSVAWAFSAFCAVAIAEGEAERAAQLLGASIAGCESFCPLTADERARYEALQNAVREAIGESALSAAEAEGRALTLELAMRLALSEESP